MNSLSPNAISALLTWQEAMHVLHQLKSPVLRVTGYCRNGVEAVTDLDIDHIWDLTKSKALVFDHMLQTLGVAELFKMEY